MLPPLRLISALCHRLQAAGISYCHWKSTEGLARSSRGDNDLDLLVSESDITGFIMVLQDLGFKEGRLPAWKDHPGIKNYFGLDEGSGRLVHVHAHYQLVLGDDMTKNYRFPVEEPYLSSAIQGSLVREPSHEFEFILLVIRMILKHGTWDAVLGLRGALSPTERREFAYLATRANETEVRRLLSEHLPYIDNDLFERCVRTLQPNCPLGFRLRVGHQLVQRISAHARRPAAIDLTLKLWRRGYGRLRRIFGRPSVRPRLAVGGAVIAVVGGDGSGKSTVVGDLGRWLSGYLATERVHLGKPPLSPSRLAVKGSMVLHRLLVRPERSSGRQVEPEPVGGFGSMRLLRHVLTARDRYRVALRARRLAANGWIVVCDRYPLNPIKLMDGPRLASIGRSSGHRGAQRRLAELEGSYYRRIAPPDVLLVLRLPPDIAAQRRPDEDPEVVRARSQEVWDLEWDRTHASVIDASLPKDQVTAKVRSLVWSRL